MVSASRPQTPASSIAPASEWRRVAGEKPAPLTARYFRYAAMQSSSDRAGGESRLVLLDSDAAAGVDASIYRRATVSAFAKDRLDAKRVRGTPTAAPQNWYQRGAAMSRASSTPTPVVRRRWPLRSNMGRFLAKSLVEAAVSARSRSRSQRRATQQPRAPARHTPPGAASGRTDRHGHKASGNARPAPPRPGSSTRQRVCD